MSTAPIVYLAAGMSSRFGGSIKQFAPVGLEGETFIEVSLNQALRVGFDDIIFIVGNMTAEPFKAKFGEEYNGVRVRYAHQNFDEATRDKPWGTADAACTVRDLVDGPFVLCNGDDMYSDDTLEQMLGHIKSSHEAAALCFYLGNVLPEQGEVTRGIYFTEKGYLTRAEEIEGVRRDNLADKGLTEKHLCNINLYALTPEALSSLHAKLKLFKQEQASDRRIEAYVHVFFGELVGEGKLRMRVYESDSSWVGITNPGDEQAVRDYLEKQSG